jgi:hypothetical protein
VDESCEESSACDEIIGGMKFEKEQFAGLQSPK